MKYCSLSHVPRIITRWITNSGVPSHCSHLVISINEVSKPFTDINNNFQEKKLWLIEIMGWEMVSEKNCRFFLSIFQIMSNPCWGPRHMLELFKLHTQDN